jgi:hypothetical protein
LDDANPFKHRRLAIQRGRALRKGRPVTFSHLGPKVVRRATNPRSRAGLLDGAVRRAIRSIIARRGGYPTTATFRRRRFRRFSARRWLTRRRWYGRRRTYRRRY